eukprot:2428788-Prymnesium_polylepis.1
MHHGSCGCVWPNCGLAAEPFVSCVMCRVFMIEIVFRWVISHCRVTLSSVAGIVTDSPAAA